MQKHFFKFKKVFTNIACSPLFLISNNSELAANYLPTEVAKAITTLEINNTKHDLFFVNRITMQKHFLKLGKVFTNVACSPLILISKARANKQNL